MTNYTPNNSTKTNYVAATNLTNKKSQCPAGYYYDEWTKNCEGCTNGHIYDELLTGV